MDIGDPEYQALSVIWNAKDGIPSRARCLRDNVVKEALKQYESFENMLDSFISLYHSIHGYKEIPDYLYGVLVHRAKVVLDKRGMTFLRFTTDDQYQIEALRSFGYRMGVSASRKGLSTQYIRFYDRDLIAAFGGLSKQGSPFRPSIDFVRGYIDGHSHFRQTTASRHRLTITGPLVPECHDFLVSLGAANTQVSMDGDSYRMNLHSKSLRAIRETLYPDGCVCNEDVKMRMFQE